MTELPLDARPMIFIVEDEDGIRTVLEMLLDLEGFQVSSASNGLEALERLPTLKCDLIITDHMMPKMDGLTFLSRVRELEGFERTPVILMSAVHRPLETVIPPANAFVAKPFEALKLIRIIQSLLSSAAS